MKANYLQKRTRNQLKNNLKRSGMRKRLFSKRMPALANASTIIENRNMRAGDYSHDKTAIL